MPTQEEIERIVTQQIAEALLQPVENIMPDSELLTELAAESIDVADIRFRLEHEFGLKIDHRGMIDALGPQVSQEDFARRFTVRYLCEHVARLLAARSTGA